MSLAGRAGYKFEPATMIQGFACHGRGVELFDACPEHVRARVRSKRTHDVDLQAQGGRLLVACSCPARSFGQTVCKHVWATLLEVDRRGGLEKLHTVKGMLPVDPAPERAPATKPAVSPKPTRSTAAPSAKRAKAGEMTPAKDTKDPKSAGAGEIAPAKNAKSTKDPRSAKASRPTRANKPRR